MCIFFVYKFIVEKSRHAAAFSNYAAAFYSPPLGSGGSGHHNSHHSSHHHGPQPQPQYVATNECRLIDYRGARIAAFLAANKNGEYLLCLPQAFEMFLKHLVGGLHTVYTKLKVSFSRPLTHCHIYSISL